LSKRSARAAQVAFQTGCQANVVATINTCYLSFSISFFVSLK
jgi:hypothetical protein